VSFDSLYSGSDFEDNQIYLRRGPIVEEFAPELIPEDLIEKV